MTNRSHELAMKDENKIVNTFKIPEETPLPSSRLGTCSEMYKRGKFGYLGAPLSLLSNASRFNILEDPCKELQPNHWASHVLKSAGTVCIDEVKMCNSLVQSPIGVNDHSLER
jgi:hypothetical protein